MKYLLILLITVISSVATPAYSQNGMIRVELRLSSTDSAKYRLAMVYSNDTLFYYDHDSLNLNDSSIRKIIIERNNKAILNIPHPEARLINCTNEHYQYSKYLEISITQTNPKEKLIIFSAVCINGGGLGYIVPDDE